MVASLQVDRFSQHPKIKQFFKEYPKDLEGALNFLLSIEKVNSLLRKIVGENNKLVIEYFQGGQEKTCYYPDSNIIGVSSSFLSSLKSSRDQNEEFVSAMVFELCNYGRNRQFVELQHNVERSAFVHPASEVEEIESSETEKGVKTKEARELSHESKKSIEGTRVLSVEEYVEAVERLEHQSGIEASNIVNKLIDKKQLSKKNPMRLILHVFEDFYRFEQLTGHSQLIASRYAKLHPGHPNVKYKGTWKYPILEDEIPLLSCYFVIKAKMESKHKKEAKESCMFMVKLMSKLKRSKEDIDRRVLKHIQSFSK